MLASIRGSAAVRHILCIVAGTILMNAGTLPAQIRYHWQDSSENTTVLVNVNQYIRQYINAHPTWFNEDKTVTDFAVQDVAAAQRRRAAEDYASIRAELELRGMAVGTYMSGTTVAPESEQTRYPATNISLEQMPAGSRYVGTWPGEPDRRIIDVSDAYTRHALQAGIEKAWKAVPAPLRFVDNAAIHVSTGRGQPWESYCQNMRELRHIGEALGSRVIFNISAHIGMLSNKELQQLTDAVGDHGIALEMPAPRLVDGNKAVIRMAELQYRKLLNTGMGIVLIPVDIDYDVLTRWVQAWRRPADHLYTARVFWKPPPTKR
jgi:hypothetical protein